MHPYLRKFLGMNWALFGLTFLILFYGIYAIYSATWMRESHFWKDQIIWMFLSLPIFFGAAMVDYRWVRWGGLFVYLASIASLLAVMVIGEKRYGAKSWLSLGFFNFQPSMVASIAGIMIFAYFLSEFRQMHPMLRLLACGAIAGAPWVMILIQPDLGACIVWVPVMFAMFFVGGIPARYLISLIIIGVGLLPIVYNFGLHLYQQKRIMTFIDPNLDPLDAGWNINQSLIAIGSGGFYGKGFKAPNTLNELGFLPSTIVHNDFIFSVMGEQHGFVGGVALLGTFALLLLVGLYIAMKAEDDLGRLLAVGIVMLIFTHTFMNIGMTISITPITGLPMPLVSYGGSFLMVTLFSLGLLQSIWIHRRVSR